MKKCPLLLESSLRNTISTPLNITKSTPTSIMKADIMNTKRNTKSLMNKSNTSMSTRKNIITRPKKLIMLMSNKHQGSSLPKLKKSHRKDCLPMSLMMKNHTINIIIINTIKRKSSKT